MGYTTKPPITVSHPQWAAQYVQERNAVPVQKITAGSVRLVWWRAEPCGHEWEAQVYSRMLSAHTCWVCSGKRFAAGVNDLATLHPEVAVQWHPTLNGDLTPVGHAPMSSTKRWWLNEVCGHTWDAPVASRTRQNTGCPFCAGKRVQVGFNDVATTHPHVLVAWHPTLNLDVTPQSVLAGSDRKVWWLCKKDHAYEMSLDHKTRLNLGCYFCSGHRVLAGFNDLATTDPALCEEWHPDRNTVAPAEVSRGSGKRVWWLCPECSHEWCTPVTSRTTVKPGRARAHGCPECAWSTWGASETETDLYEALRATIPDLESAVALQRSPEFAAKRRTWRVDLFSPALNLVIEYDGELWHLPEIFPGGVEKGEAVRARDHAKTEDLLARGYRVVRVRSGRLPKITSEDLLVPTQMGGALVAVLLVEHLRGLGVLPEGTAAA